MPRYLKWSGFYANTTPLTPNTRCLRKTWAGAGSLVDRVQTARLQTKALLGLIQPEIVHVTDDGRVYLDEAALANSAFGINSSPPCRLGSGISISKAISLPGTGSSDNFVLDDAVRERGVGARPPGSVGFASLRDRAQQRFACLDSQTRNVIRVANLQLIRASASARVRQRLFILDWLSVHNVAYRQFYNLPALRTRDVLHLDDAGTCRGVAFARIAGNEASSSALSSRPARSLTNNTTRTSPSQRWPITSASSTSINCSTWRDFCRTDAYTTGIQNCVRASMDHHAACSLSST